MTRPRSTNKSVTVVSFDPSTNALGRALLIAELLGAEFEPKIVGLRSQPEIWAPARSSPIPIETLELEGAASLPGARAWLSERISGSRVVVCKPLTTSLGVSVAAGAQRHSLLLDIDDWEVGLYDSHAMRGYHGAARIWKISRDLLDPSHLNSYASTIGFDRLARLFPHRLVSNAWLAKRFGGSVLPHVRDTHVLDPERVDARQTRCDLAMDGRVWVGFVGTLRSHKGVDGLVEALAELEGTGAPGLFLAGVDRQDPYVSELLERAHAKLGAARLRVVESFDIGELPRLVSAADVICLPSRSEPGARGQIPAKLFDAMTMARPVIASDVNEMGAILDGCGVLVEPDNVRALARAISELAADPSRRAELGRLARRRAMERYSFGAGRRILTESLDRLDVPRR